MSTAHALLRPAIDVIVERARRDAERVAASGSADSLDAEDALHDFRVDLRRLRTLLRAAGDLYDTSRVKEIGREIKRQARATSTLRDEEVLAGTLRAVELAPRERAAIEDWLERRRPYEERLRQGVVLLVSGPELPSALAALAELVAAGPIADEPAAMFATDRISVARHGVTALLPVDREDGKRLHELRIRFKRLRYVAELIERQYPDGPERAHEDSGVDTAALARDAARLQDALGVLHDTDQALALVEATEEEVWAEARAALLEGLRARRAQQVEAAMAELERGGWQR
jgi:CHAD domain-containing protein